MVIPGKLVSELENYLRLNAFGTDDFNNLLSPLNSINHLDPNHNVVPIGLGHYLQIYDAPSSMVSVRNFLDAARRHLNGLAKGSVTSLGLDCNLGLLLRWHCALHTMEAYQRLCRFTFADAPRAVVAPAGQDASPGR